MGRELIILAVMVLTVVQICPTMQSGRNKGGDQHKKDLARINAAQETSFRAVDRATSTIFDIIQSELNKIAHGKFQEGGRCRIVTRAGRERITKYYRVQLDEYLKGARIAQPEAGSTIHNVRLAAYNALDHVVGNIIAGIELASSKNPRNIPKEIEKYEKEAIKSASHMLKVIWLTLLNGRDSSTTLGADLRNARQKTIEITDDAFQGIFRGIRVFLDRVFPKLRLENISCSSINSIRDNTLEGFQALVKSVFAEIHVLFDDDSSGDTYDDQ